MKRGPSALRPAAPWLGVAAAAAFLFFMRIGMPLTDGDTAYYAKVALNILETGNWQTMRFKDYVIVDKPPLTMWLIALSYLVLGVNETAIRAWHAAMAVGTVLVTYFAARLFYSERTAALSGWILLTSALFVYCGLVPQQDVPLTFFSTLALYGFARAVRDRAWGFLYLTAASTALGVLSRGVQAALFPAAVMGLVWVDAAWGALRGRAREPERGRERKRGPELMSGRQPTSVRELTSGREPTSVRELTSGRGLNGRRELERRPVQWAIDPAGWFRDARALVHAAGAAVLFVVIAVPWYVLEARVHGQIFIDVFLGSDHARFYGGPSAMRGALEFWAYFPMLLAAVLPWSGLILPGAFGAYRRAKAAGRLGGAFSGDRFFLLWFMIAFAVPHLIGWRVIRYLLPVLPPLAVLIAAYLAPVLEERKGTRTEASTGRGASPVPAGERSEASPARVREKPPKERGLRIAAVVQAVVVLIVLALAVAFLPAELTPEQRSQAKIVMPFLIVMAFAMGVFAVAVLLRRYSLAARGLVAGGFLAYAVLIWSVGAIIDEVLPWKRAAVIVNASAGPRDAVVWAEGGDNTFLDFYITRPVLRDRDLLALEPGSVPGVWLLGTRDAVGRLGGEAGLDLREVERLPGIVIARAEP